MSKIYKSFNTNCSSIWKRILPIELFLIFISIFLSSCYAGSEPLSKSGFFFDTYVTFTYYDSADSEYIDEALNMCNEYDRLFSRTIEGSDIYKINHFKGEYVEVDERTIDILKEAIFYCEMSEGRADITVADLMMLWNFTNGDGTVPSDDEIKALLPGIDYHNIIIDEDNKMVKLKSDSGSLDLGFIAKGYITSKLRDYLTESGVKSCVIDLGGNLYMIGTKPDGSEYNVGIKKPFTTANETIDTVSISNKAVVTSGIYERYFEADGQIYHHILDLNTGYSVDNNVYSVTIICEDATKADALSTICLIYGIDDGLDLINSMDETEAIYVDDEYNLHYSQGLNR